MSTNKTKKITKTKTPIKNTTRKLPVFHHLTKTSHSRMVGVQSYKINCGKNLLSGYNTIKASEETSIHKDDFVHIILTHLKDYNKPVVVKIYDENNIQLRIEQKILQTVNEYRNTAKLICDFSCKDDKNNYIAKIKKSIHFCKNDGPDLLHFFVYEYVPNGDLSNFLHLCTFKTPINSAFMSDKGNCYHALEKCEGVIKNKKNIPVIKTLILQITCVIIQLATIYKIYHGDINSGNILIDTIDDKTIDYRIEEQTFTIQTYGVMPKVIDYGRSKFYKGDILPQDIWDDITVALGVIYNYIENAELKKNIYNISNNFDIRFTSVIECYIYVRDNL
jgi:serine/threonine protein kinase